MPRQDQQQDQIVAEEQQEKTQLDGNSGKKKKWLDLFSSNRLYTEDMILEFVEPTFDRVVLCAEDVDTVEEAAGFCLVEQFLGRFPSWQAVKDIANRWKVHTNCKYINSSGSSSNLTWQR